MTDRYLTLKQNSQLHRWLARGLPYREIRRLMTTYKWQQIITSQACGWHKKKYADEIESLRRQYQQKKTHTHCETCTCFDAHDHSPLGAA